MQIKREQIFLLPSDCKKRFCIIDSKIEPGGIHGRIFLRGGALLNVFVMTY